MNLLISLCSLPKFFILSDFDTAHDHLKVIGHQYFKVRCDSKRLNDDHTKVVDHNDAKKMMSLFPVDEFFIDWNIFAAIFM